MNDDDCNGWAMSPADALDREPSRLREQRDDDNGWSYSPADALKREQGEL